MLERIFNQAVSPDMVKITSTRRTSLLKINSESLILLIPIVF